MEPNMKLYSAKLPKALGELVHSNQFLKISNLISFGISFLLLAFIFYQSTRPPIVLPLDPTGLPYATSKPPKPEDEISRAVLAYVDLRYKWDAKNVADRLKRAEAFILPQSRTAYESAVANVEHFSIEKNVAQKIRPDEPLVDLNNKLVRLTGDRITAIQGLKAAGDLKLELSFESGPRTAQNPWGVYVVKEREE